MNELDLILELQRQLAEHLKSYKFPAQSGALSKINVHSLKLPNPNVLDSNLYPLVFLEIVGSQDDAQQSLTQILITCGTYSTDNLAGGLMDLTILTQAVKNFLLTHKLIGSFSLQYPVDTMFTEADSADFYFSQTLAEYKGFTVQNNFLEY